MYKHFYPSSSASCSSPAVSNPDNTDLDEKTSIVLATDQPEVDRRADQFASFISKAEIKVSIAAIQGFLLLYKKDPVAALEKAPAWVEVIRKEQEEAANKSIASGNGHGQAKGVSVTVSDASESEVGA